MRRTELNKRKLPGYTRGEEIFNMVSHIAGGALGVVAIVICVVVAALNGNVWGIVSGAIYGTAVLLLFTVSSVYHGLYTDKSKKVMQVIDHCTIYILIAGTYTVVLLNRFREVYPTEAWTMFGIVWALAALGITLNAIDLKRFKLFSMISYLGMGWLAVLELGKLTSVLPFAFFVFLILGGVSYTVGAVFYLVGKKRKYMHSVFHIFVDVAALLHFLGVVFFILPG